jgi:hypothetical protein
MLTAYLGDMIEMASTTKGSAFLQQRNIRIDWAIRDTKLFTTIFAGQMVNRCDLCNSVTHSSHFCPRNKNINSKNHSSSKHSQSTSLLDVQGRPRIKHKGKEICNNFNSATGCQRKAHICSECKFHNHAAPMCNKAKAKQSGISDRS